MVARVTANPDPILPPSDPNQLRPVREAVSVLGRLLKVLFPEQPSLDVITVENVIERYPLTGLGAPALAAIEQSQRIVRGRNDYNQLGLGEFHVGLIYLYWDDCRAAANQFSPEQRTLTERWLERNVTPPDAPPPLPSHTPEPR